jgi:hypothetical protein
MTWPGEVAHLARGNDLWRLAEVALVWQTTVSTGLIQMK